MGLFDALFGKKKTEDDGADAPRGAGEARMSSAAPAPRGWSAKLAQARSDPDWDWDWDNPRARQLVNDVLHEIAPHFGDAKVKEIPDDEHIDLRGIFDGSPVRFAIWMSFGTFWAIQMKASHAMEPLEVERDHEKIPKHKEADDPWDTNEERRVFVAKGIFFEGDDGEINERLDRWARLPELLKVRILVDMERLDCRTVRAYGQEISVHQRPGLGELEDPLAYMQDCARLMAEIRNHAPRADDAAASTPAVEIAGLVLGTRVTCAFCSSLYLQTPTSNNCPNCGAPPKG